MHLEPRPHCYRCDKPMCACLCARIPRVENQTPIVLLQHRREARHPLGTARIAALGLTRVRVEVLAADERSGEALPDWLPSSAGLLYPRPHARDLAEVPASEMPSALVVIDGTWHQARALYRDHRWLHRLPAFSLEPRAPSRYRIRREPSPECVSTIEAIVQALSVLEPDTPGLSGLIDAFDDLIDDQLENRRTRATAPRQRERRPFSFRRLPRGLLEDFERLVVIYGEATHPGGDLSRETELVQWAALRVGDGAVFDCVVRPAGGLPSPGHVRHLGLSREDIERGLAPADFSSEWRRFCRGDDVFAAWNPRTLSLLERSGGSAERGFGLKGAYHRVRKARGDLDAILAAERARGLAAFTAPALEKIRGRARERIGNALAAATLLRRLALDSAMLQA